MKYPRKGRIRLVVDLPIDLYYALEKGTYNANTTLTIYVARALNDKFLQERITIDDADREFFAKKINARRHKIYSSKSEEKP